MLKVDWNPINNLIISGGEDCKYKVLIARTNYCSITFFYSVWFRNSIVAYPDVGILTKGLALPALFNCSLETIVSFICRPMSSTNFRRIILP